jgi:glycine/D-amino acid oxidase-like deaminating enzyme
MRLLHCMTGVVVEGDNGAKQTLPAATVVNCGGPWAGGIAAMHGLDLPVVPRRRWVYQVACDDPRYAPTVRCHLQCIYCYLCAVFVTIHVSSTRKEF